MLSFILKKESQLHYLPMMYLLPEELIIRCPTLRKLPRRVREILYHENMREIIESDQFINELSSAAAWLIFPHFGFPGWVENYSENCPAWKFAFFLALYNRVIIENTGWDLQRLLYIPSIEYIPFFDSQYVKAIFGAATKTVVKQQGWQKFFDVIKAMPCHEDYEPVKSNIRIDFHRSWYHTRSKKVKMIDIEKYTDSDKEDLFSTVAVDHRDIAEHIVSDDFCERFKKSLEEKDRKILELREEGYTYEEIANELEYKTHSAVIKRMEAVKKKFIEYNSKQK